MRDAASIVHENNTPRFFTNEPFVPIIRSAKEMKIGVTEDCFGLYWSIVAAEKCFSFQRNPLLEFQHTSHNGGDT